MKWSIIPSVLLPFFVGSMVTSERVLAECMPNYSGVTLKVGSQQGPFIASALRAAGDAWEQETCGKVTIIEFPFSELFPKFLTMLQTGTSEIDVISYIPAWLPNFNLYLSEMPLSMQNGEYWRDILPVYRERLMKWDGKVKSATMDGDIHIVNYRADLFNDPLEKDAFREKYGYELTPPATWDQYYDIAEFFHRPEQGLYGTAEAYKRGGQQFWYFFSHAASYTNNPKNPGSMFFDPDTMNAQINNQGWLKALQDYKRGLAFNPPNALNNGSSDIRPLYAGGKVAMNIDWADSAVSGANPQESSIVGHVRTSMLPGSKSIWNAKESRWDHYDEVLFSPFLAFGGWQLAVPQLSKKKGAAWNFVQIVTSQEQSSKAIVTANTGVNPYRLSHYDDIENWLAVFSQPEAESYLATQRKSLDAPNLALDLRIPGFFAYTEILEIELSRTLTEEITEQEALDNVAKQWNKLTDDLGRDSQLKAYRSAMGLATQ